MKRRNFLFTALLAPFASWLPKPANPATYSGVVMGPDFAAKVRNRFSNGLYRNMILAQMKIVKDDMQSLSHESFYLGQK